MKISKNFAVELTAFHFVRQLDDGIDFFNFECQADWYRGDHNPRFLTMLTILNFKIFEFMIYNVNHIKED